MEAKRKNIKKFRRSQDRFENYEKQQVWDLLALTRGRSGGKGLPPDLLNYIGDSGSVGKDFRNLIPPLSNIARRALNTGQTGARVNTDVRKVRVPKPKKLKKLMYRKLEYESRCRSTLSRLWVGNRYATPKGTRIHRWYSPQRRQRAQLFPVDACRPYHHRKISAEVADFFNKYALN